METALEEISFKAVFLLHFLLLYHLNYILNMVHKILFFTILLSSNLITSQITTPPEIDLRLYDIIDSVSATRIEADIQTLVGFGTRHTFSDTVSDTRGIGAARRWIKAEFEKISENCDGCSKLYFQNNFVTPKDGERIPFDAWIKNVVGVAAVGKNSHESVVVFPSGVFRN